MNKKEYFESIRAQVANDASRQGGRKLLKSSAMLLAAALAAIGIGMGISHAQRNSAYEHYQQSGELSYEYLDVKDAFASWTQKDVGNDVDALLAGGKILLRDNLRVTGASSVPAESGFRQIPDASYLNLVGNTIVYRSDKDRHVYAADRDSLQSRLLYDGNAGEVFCVGTRVYFIDYDAGGIVSYLDLTAPSDKKAVTAEGVSSFAVCGDEVLYLNAAHTLRHAALSAENGAKIHPKDLMQRVERFYLCDAGIVAESRDTVASFTMQGDRVQRRYRSADGDMQVAGFLPGQQLLLIRENGSYAAVRLGPAQAQPLPFDGADKRTLTSLVQDEAGAIYGVACAKKDTSSRASELVGFGTVGTAETDGKAGR